MNNSLNRRTNLFHQILSAIVMVLTFSILFAPYGSIMQVRAETGKTAVQGPNLALNKKATQSSTSNGANASRAVDGVTDGSWSKNSVTHTNLEYRPWLQIDLGAVYDISEIKIYNRTDCCQERLDKFWVVYSDSEIINNGNAANGTPVKSFASTGPMGASTQNPRILRENAKNVRYIRIYITGTNYLHLAEVEVFGTNAQNTSTTTTPSANLALNKKATQSSTSNGANASRAVDGGTDGNWNKNSVTHTNLEYRPWWQIDLGAVYDISEIKIYNRTDSVQVQQRLDSFWVVYSDSEIINNGNTVKGTGVKSYASTGPWGASTQNPRILKENAKNVRYIRIYLTGTNYLHLAEVQVFGISSNSTASTTTPSTTTPSAGNCSLSDWAGEWNTNFNLISWQAQPDGSLVGTYNTAKHHIQAKPVNGNSCVVEGTWRHRNSSSVGRIKFTMDPDKRSFKGAWSNPNQIPTGTNWTGTKSNTTVATTTPTPTGSSGQAGAFTVKGIIRDAARGPVSGATVTEKGTSNKITTDAQGFYQLKVGSSNATLVFSYPLAWLQEVPVNSRTVIDMTPICNTGPASGGSWVNNGCTNSSVVTVGSVDVGCSAGKKQIYGGTTCIPEVKFEIASGVNLDRAQNIAVSKGWVLATPDEIYEAWRDLKYDHPDYGILYDGQHALPIQRDKLPAWERGANVGISAPLTQGFFYVETNAVSRSQSPPPAATCKNTVVNPMIDGWRTRDPLLVKAGESLLRKEGKPVNQQQITQLAAQLSSDPVRRWQFAPFMLREMWNAVSTTNPTPAQDQVRRKFESWVACDDMQIAQQTLAMWNANIEKTWTTQPKEYCSGEKIEVTTFSGQKILAEEPCQEVSAHFMAPITGYQYNTLGVLFNPRKGGKYTVEGFLPLDNPQFFGYRGRQAMNLLFRPMIVNNLPDFDDKQNLRPLGSEMSQMAKEIGIHAGGMAVVGSVVGTVVLGEAVRRTAGQVWGANQNAAIKTKDIIQQLVSQGKTYEVAAKEAAEASANQSTKVTAKAVGKNFVKTLVQAGKKTGEETGEKVAKKLVTQVLSKFGSAIAVVGIVVTMGEIFGRVVADVAKTNEFDANINKAAKELQPYRVKDILGNSPGETEKALVFTKLVKMTIADPADANKLSFALPPLDCPSGKKESSSRTCVNEVKYHSQAGLTLAQSRNIAVSNGWQLASPEEVSIAWLELDLEVYALGRMADGRFAVPVQRDYSNFKIGPNIDARGGNQGFFYKAYSAKGLSWKNIPLRPIIKHISVGNDGTTWIVDSNDLLLQGLADGKWGIDSGRLKQISVGSAEHVWGVNGSDEIYRRDGQSWTGISGRLKHVSVGGDGTVWGVNSADQIWRWTGSNWENIPGKLKQISVGSANHIWGVSSLNQIFRRNGQTWTRIPGVLKYVSVGDDGEVWGINPSNQIYRWTGSAWEKIPGNLKQISVGRSGEVWGVNSGGEVWTRVF